MTVPFASTLRARPRSIELGSDSETRLSVRVEVPEAWDVVRIDAPPETPVAELKRLAIAELLPSRDLSAFVTKLHGLEVLDERMSLAEAGVRTGSTLLVTHRRRRPVR